MTVPTPPPPRPDYAPTPGLVTTWSDYTRQAVPGTTTVVHHHYSAPTTPVIPTLAPDHHDAVDWQRVKRSLRALRPQHPLKAGATVCAGAVLGPWWTGFAVTPLIDLYGPAAALGLTTMTGIYAGVAMTRVRPIIRRVVAVALVAAVTGTLYAAPVRDLIAAWIMES